ncbi:hypothetical protein ACQP1G_16580 [Nocardia sp. CA-107356]|uniref:hypothetical protein n=1 Tax=Nocardia sp. CA-107356 TaxID=3239972 RepID=UPI003D8DE071
MTEVVADKKIADSVVPRVALPTLNGDELAAQLVIEGKQLSALKHGQQSILKAAKSTARYLFAADHR